MEAADDDEAFFAEALDQVVGVEDQLAGALDGAEQGDWGAGREGGVLVADEAFRFVKTSRDGLSTVRSIDGSIFAHGGQQSLLPPRR